jgi:hypothetical protein
MALHKMVGKVESKLKGKQFYFYQGSGKGA